MRNWRCRPALSVWRDNSTLLLIGEPSLALTFMDMASNAAVRRESIAAVLREAAMLHLIDAQNRHLPLSAALLENSYRVRHDAYVTGRGWKALARADGREVTLSSSREDARCCIVSDHRNGLAVRKICFSIGSWTW